uniref:Reverse transcriptase zinc-binding domain-containing protein n=1 Tax=Fagus sylvatica TaxID=28930 RepID=A0A2N9I6T1_FAGSY
MWVRLDRGVATMEWIAKFPTAQVERVNVSKSNHKCLWLDLSPLVLTRNKRHPFRFEEIWMTDLGCEETIKNAWEVAKPDSQSAFVPGRLITDNILVAFETLHHMQHNKMGRDGAMALKLDMKAIKNIPLSDCAPPDKLIWPGTSHGNYTVKSGYHALLHEENRLLPSSSDTDALQPIWNTVWSLRIPKKCQHFAWRASREALPTKMNLCKRHIPIDPVCENCCTSPEDTLHAIWKCPLIQMAWENETWIHIARDSPLLDYADLLSKVRAYLEEYANGSEAPIPQVPIPVLEVRWQPPRRCKFKVNYDGAVFQETNEARIGVIVRDSKGKVMASLVQKVRYPQSVESIEA